MKKENILPIVIIICVTIFSIVGVLVNEVHYEKNKNYQRATTLITPYCNELCEYSKDNLHFKAPCDVVKEFLYFELDKKSFEEYKSNIINDFENNCQDFMKDNIYYNTKKDGDKLNNLRNVTFEQYKENFKKGIYEDLQFIIDLSCGVN